MPSVGLNWKEPDSILFGDGAAAVVLGRTPAGMSSRVLLARMETYAEAADLCQIRGGGTRIYGTNYTAERHEEFLFDMQGPKLYRLAYRKLPRMLDIMFAGSGLSLHDMDLIVPHQASLPAVERIERRLKITTGRWKSIFGKYGNCIAASIPLALHEAIEDKELVRGQRCLLLGTGAGFACGAVAFEY
jgi:3-oxoacyl-[acyl-carrier-protein] synthase-3